jgi:hypothetical protein
MKDETSKIKPAGYLQHMGEVRMSCGVLTAENDPSGSLNRRKRCDEIDALAQAIKAKREGR